jgi:hypothetical protein
MAGTVIHDITPGIDFAGITTSPVYQVGDYSNVFNNAYDPDVQENEVRNQDNSVASAVAGPTQSSIPTLPTVG